MHPLNVTTPAASVPVQPDNVPGPPVLGVLVVIESLTVELSDVTVLPAASSTVTTGCVPRTAALVEFDGWTVILSWVPEPPTSNDALFAASRAPSFAVSS